MWESRPDRSESKADKTNAFSQSSLEALSCFYVASPFIRAEFPSVQTAFLDLPCSACRETPESCHIISKTVASIKRKKAQYDYRSEGGILLSKASLTILPGMSRRELGMQRCLCWKAKRKETVKECEAVE